MAICFLYVVQLTVSFKRWDPIWCNIFYTCKNVLDMVYRQNNQITSMKKRCQPVLNLNNVSSHLSTLVPVHFVWTVILRSNPQVSRWVSDDLMAASFLTTKCNFNEIYNAQHRNNSNNDADSVLCGHDCKQYLSSLSIYRWIVTSTCKVSWRGNRQVVDHVVSINCFSTGWEISPPPQLVPSLLMLR